MRKLRKFAYLAFAIVLFCTNCVSGQGKGKYGYEGMIKFQNLSGEDMSIFIDKEYKDTVKTGNTVNIPVYMEGNPEWGYVFIEVYFRNKIDPKAYPGEDTRYRYSFFTFNVLPLNSPENNNEPIIITENRLKPIIFPWEK